MHFLILAYDGTEPGVYDRRMAVRQSHIDCIAGYKAKGNMIIGAALLDDNEKMIGSIIIADFPDKMELDKWLNSDPYVTNKVWDKIIIQQCKVAPSFTDMLKK